MTIPALSAGYETELALQTEDDYTIYCIRNQPAETQSDRLVVIAHGVTGFATEYLHQMAARYFVAKGYDVIRFFFYTADPRARKLRHCTLIDHVNDLRHVINTFRGPYLKSFVCGHSYGGMTTLLTNPDVDAVSLWDSTIYPYARFWQEFSRFDPDVGSQLIDHGYEVLIGYDMVEEGTSYEWDDMQAIARNMIPPVQVTVASEHVDRPGQKQFYDELTVPKDYVVIEGAGHEFTEGDTVFDLLDRTHQWFERF